MGVKAECGLNLSKFLPSSLVGVDEHVRPPDGCFLDSFYIQPPSSPFASSVSIAHYL